MKNTKKRKLNNLLKTRRISDRHYKNKKQAIEKWVEAERKQIKSTKNMLLQGWMKANEIIGHLAKDKYKVIQGIQDKRRKLSPTSQLSMDVSNLSFCRSDNSFGTNEPSSFSQVNKSHLNYTSDYDVCNNLRRMSRPRHKQCKFNVRSNIINKAKQLQVAKADSGPKIEDTKQPLKPFEPQQDPTTEKQVLVKEINKPKNTVITPDEKSKSESLNWDPAEGQSSYDKNEGYINQCIQDIRKYYADKVLDKEISDKSYSSHSSSFNMQQKDRSEGDIQEEVIDGKRL